MELDIRERLEQYNAHAVEQAKKHDYVPAVFDSEIDHICEYELRWQHDWSVDLIELVEVEDGEERVLELILLLEEIFLS
jgi:hypothetical protein